MVPTPFVFGKVPSRGDFVRAGRIGPLVDDLDGWLQRALLGLRGSPAADAPAVSFVFGRPQGTLAGSFVASRDRSGREFPLVAGGALEGAPPVTGSAIASLASFLSASAGAAAAVVAGTSPDDALALLRPPPPLPGSGATLPPGDVPPAALAPFREREAPRYGLALPLPAGDAGRAAAAGHWLDRLTSAGPGRPSRSVLWSSAPDARAVVFAGPPSADCLAYLLLGKAVDGVYEVEPAAAERTAP